MYADVSVFTGAYGKEVILLVNRGATVVKKINQIISCSEDLSSSSCECPRQLIGAGLAATSAEKGM